MSEATPVDLSGAIDDVRLQLADLAERLARLEKSVSAPAPAALAARSEKPDATAAAHEAKLPVAVDEGISEEELLAISAALAAWLGVRAHIRQIRLIRTGVWAQEGRVTIQASHWLHIKPHH
jgi:methylmalonyl-CoA carboxyltransferase large subunit